MLDELRARGRAALRDAAGLLPAVGVRRSIEAAGCPRTVACLIATKRGLYVARDGGIDHLLRGEFYGATRRGADWYVFQKLGSEGRILRLRLDGGPVVVGRRVGPALSNGCHQIDFVDDALYVADTYNNRLLVLSVALDRAELLREYQPFGALAQGRKSANYVHMNSLWRGEDGLHVLLHNETQKTGRPSELVTLTPEGRVARRTPTQASHAHNVLVLRGKHLYCDSQRGALRWGDDVVFECDLFTRGLAVTRDHILVGGSQYGARSQRDALRGSLFVLSHDFTLLASVPIPGMVQEVRGLHDDLGLSQDARRWARGGS